MYTSWYRVPCHSVACETPSAHYMVLCVVFCYMVLHTACTFHDALYRMHIFFFYIVRCILVHGALYTIYTKNLKASLSSLLKQLLYTNQCFVPSSLQPFSNKPRASLYACSVRLSSSRSSLRSFAADLVAMLNCRCPGRLSVCSHCTHSQVTLMLVSQVSMEW
ncbi:unnamed protein product [Ixodes pacificus]